MQDTLTAAPTPVLIDHIRTRYHDTHRREFPDLIALAREIETTHADDPNSPHGLTRALESMIEALETHMREEELVFHALQDGSARGAAGAFPGLREAHGGQEAALNRIAAITHGFRVPRYAGRNWRRLYGGLGKLVEDLDEHMYLENEVLFPRFEART